MSPPIPRSAPTLPFRYVRASVIRPLSHGLLPGIRALGRQYRGLAVHVVDHDAPTLGTFAAFRVSSTPYVVAVDNEGIVQARGVANSLEQIEMMLAEAAAAGAAHAR